MARKTLGFIPLIWTCPYCETQNPGPIKSCTGCGAPQPPDVKFTQVDEETFNFIKDEALIRMAKAGPDIHCPFCGTRNPSTAKLCKKCGGDLSMGGQARQTGQRVETAAEAQAQPPVPTTTKKPSRAVPIIAVFAVLACIAVFVVIMMLMFKTDDITATVTNVAWERSVAIEAFTTITDRTWLDEIPADAEIGSCTQAYRYTSEQFVANATEVCSEAYVEDTGTGIGEVVQECVYRVYDDYCEYSYLGWVIVDTVVDSGNDIYPSWPNFALSNDQREGNRQEKYQIIFSDGGDRYTYTTTDADLFMEAQPGSEWILNVNSLGGVQSIEPAN